MLYPLCLCSMLCVSCFMLYVLCLCFLQICFYVLCSMLYAQCFCVLCSIKSMLFELYDLCLCSICSMLHVCTSSHPSLRTLFPYLYHLGTIYASTLTLRLCFLLSALLRHDIHEQHHNTARSPALLPCSNIPPYCHITPYPPPTAVPHWLPAGEYTTPN
jgi:hypothetical protein